jgi:septal ring-binding cell division protein DamX
VALKPAVEATPLNAKSRSLTDSERAIVKELQSWPANNVTLQLGVFSDQQVLERFYQRKEIAPLRNELREYPVIKNDNVRHVVILGNFVNREAALLFLSKQPSSLRGLKPWVKSIAAVHQDLSTVLQEPASGER